MTTNSAPLIRDTMAGLVAYVSSDEEDEDTRNEAEGSRVRREPETPRGLGLLTG